MDITIERVSAGSNVALIIPESESGAAWLEENIDKSESIGWKAANQQGENADAIVGHARIIAEDVLPAMEDDGLSILLVGARSAMNEDVRLLRQT